MPSQLPQEIAHPRECQAFSQINQQTFGEGKTDLLSVLCRKVMKMTANDCMCANDFVTINVHCKNVKAIRRMFCLLSVVFHK